MEHAFQRQVIYGGCLDTILLEMNLVPEERLVQYLSLATGLPPATRGEMDVFDAEAMAKCPVDAARAYRVVPLCFEEGALRVLVHDPVDLGLLEELANDLEFPVQPLVAPEYRFHLVFARTYGGTPNARFVALAKRAEEATPSSPVGKARTVIVDEGSDAIATGPMAIEDSADHQVVDVGLPPSQSLDDDGLDNDGLDNDTLDDDGLDDDELDDDGLDDDELDDDELDDDSPTEVRPSAQEIHSSSQFDDAPTLPRGRKVTHSEDDLAVAQTEPVPMETLVQTSVQTAEPASGKKSRRAQPRTTMLGVGVPGEATFTPATRPVLEQPQAGANKAITEPMGSRNAPTGEDRVVGHTPEPAPAGTMSEQPAAQPTVSPTGPAKASRPAPAKPVGGELRAEPLDPGQARVELAAAEDRDLIFGCLLRALRYHAWYAGLLTVQGGAAIGRIAIAGDQVDRQDIGEVLIPLDTPSAFHNVVESASPHIGPIATGDPDIDGMLERMGQAGEANALLLPVVLRNRVVAIALAHSRDESLDMSTLPELFPLANLAADAILQLLVKAKSASKARMRAESTQTAPAGPAPAETAPAAVQLAESEPAAVQPAEPEPLPPPPESTQAEPELSAEVEPAAEVQSIAMEADEPEPIDAVLDVIEGDDKELARQAMAEALRRIGEVKQAVATRFPGKLLVDRYELGGRVMPAGQHGPLLQLVVDMGEAATDLLIAKMGDSKHEVRYYATLCTEEIRPRTAVAALVERLFDSDYGTRNAAITALAGYPPGALDKGLARARQALRSDNPSRVQAAANALARLADIRAIPELLDAVARGDKGTDHARRALVQLTAQNFGTSTRKWRSWWSKHQDEHRIEWLIEGLGHKDENIRRAAAEELRKLTGEYFDYHHDASKRERESGRKRWAEWWRDVGHSRYTR